MKKLRIISRKSTLARIQAHIVGSKLTEAYPDLQVEYITKKTHGDIDLTTPLSQMPDRGVFTNDIRDELLKNTADIAVHSWKDLPVEMEPGTEISATIERSDMRDILLLKKSSRHKKQLDLLTSSPRRAYNLEAFLPKALPSQPNKINFLNIRGNIATRIDKLMQSDADGLVMAKAALDRIISANTSDTQVEVERIITYLKDLSWMVLPISENPAAPAQGALAIESRTDDVAIKDLLQAINRPDVFTSVVQERTILKQYGGGCHQKIGVSCQNIPLGKIVSLRGLTDAGNKLDSREFTANINLPDWGEHPVTKIFPAKDEQHLLFLRQEIPAAKATVEAIQASGIYISRSNALPENTQIDSSNTIWASGVKTWFNLAKRGYWVNGCSDELGEQESKAESLLGEITWYKLAHDQATAKEKTIVASYSLKPNPNASNLENISHFYWMSASAFHHAMAKQPSIVNAQHACGLGQTYHELNAIIPDKLKPYLNYQSWLNDMQQRSQ